MCTGQSGAQARAPRELAALEFLRVIPLKFIRLSGAPPDCPVRQRSNGQLRQRSIAVQSGRQKSEDNLQRQVASDYPVPQEDKILQWSTTPNPNGQLMWHAPDSEQCCVQCTTGLSVVPIDSQVSQQLGSDWRL
jgi:hypothetical protein